MRVGAASSAYRAYTVDKGTRLSFGEVSETLSEESDLIQCIIYILKPRYNILNVYNIFS